MWKSFARKLGSLPWLTFSAGALALVIWLLPDSLETLLVYSRTQICNGAFWQLLTGHFVHWNFEHLWVDLAVFTFIGSMVERRSRILWVGLLFLSIILISFSVFLWRSDIETYRGLSGVDMAFAGFWILDSFLRSLRSGAFGESLVWAIVLLGVFLKPIIEMFLGHPIFVQDLGSNVVGLPISHVVGVIVGCGVMLFVEQRFTWLCRV